MHIHSKFVLRWTKIAPWILRLVVSKPAACWSLKHFRQVGVRLGSGGDFLQALAICVIFLLSTDEVDATWVAWKHMWFPTRIRIWLLLSLLLHLLECSTCSHASIESCGLRYTLHTHSKACKSDSVCLVEGYICIYIYHFKYLYALPNRANQLILGKGIWIHIFEAGFRNSGMNLLVMAFSCWTCAIEEYRFAEFFAGEANVSWCLKQYGFRGLTFDSTYGGRYNNIFEPSGFAHLVCKQKNKPHVCFVQIELLLSSLTLPHLFRDSEGSEMNMHADMHDCIDTPSSCAEAIRTGKLVWTSGVTILSSGVRCWQSSGCILAAWFCWRLCAPVSPSCVPVWHRDFGSRLLGTSPKFRWSLAMSWQIEWFSYAGCVQAWGTRSF